MKYGTWLLPLLALAGGVIPLRFDLQQQRWKLMMACVLVIVAALTIWSGVHDDSTSDATHRVELKSEKDQIGKLSAQLDDLKTILLNGSGSLNTGHPLPAQIDTTIRSIQDSQAIVAVLPAGSAKSLRIEFFPHLKEDVNPEIVLAKLRGLAATVEEKHTGAAGVNNIPTNCIWVGKNVVPDEARAVALTLTAAGVHIRDIRELRDPSAAGGRLIEIGSSTRVLSMPVLSPDEIRTRPITPRTDPRY